MRHERSSDIYIRIYSIENLSKMLWGQYRCSFNRRISSYHADDTNLIFLKIVFRDINNDFVAHLNHFIY